jgi:trehalose 6-phosphate synthase/phosphatase
MARLLLVSNRLPVMLKVEGQQVHVSPSPGGLATGLKGPHQQSGGHWIGWPGDVSALDDVQLRELDAQLEALRCVPMHLSPAEVHSYYEGFANRVLWPLFHYLLDRIPLHSRDWEAYRKVNERFADVAARHYRKGDLIWVHDYQLLLLPRLLRDRLPEALIGFFLHIPFPSSEVFRILPWRESLLDGLLGADLIGFHTLTYVRHFANSLSRVLGVGTEVDRIVHRGREIRLGAFPMGVDAAFFSSLAESPEVRAQVEEIRQHAQGHRILLGVDRLDYTKGIPRRLLALERLLEREPALRGKIRLIQVAVPSRTKVDAYEAFRHQVDELVGRINGAYGTIGSTPIHYLYQSFGEKELTALYRAADVMLITALRDGMNLVAKEFVASRTDEDGVLVLSEFAGAASELGEAVMINPYDVDNMSRAMLQALAMPEEERKLRIRTLRHRVAEFDVHRWAHAFISALEERGQSTGPRARRLSTRDEIGGIVARARDAQRLVLLLDYDGTLVSFIGIPELAAPGERLRELLRALAASRGTDVHLVSGRRKEQLDRWFADLPIGLHAEHGLWSRPRPDRDWAMMRDVPSEWKEKVRPIMAQFSALVPGSFIEEKTATLAWHYRMAEEQFAVHQSNEMYLHLTQVFANVPVEVLQGDKVIEVRPHGVSKALVAQKVLREAPSGTLCIALGDDRTDEDLFAALPAESIAVHVGPKPSAAPFRLSDVDAARALVEEIAKARS